MLVAEPPNPWLARDTDGDLRADTKELVTNTYGRLEANVEHNANSLLWALDNWMHTSETDVFCGWRNGAFEVRKTLSRGQWGASQDDAGRIYRNSNESVLHVDLVPTPYYARNPNLVRTRGSYESLRGDKNEVMTVWPGRPTPAVNRGYQTGVLRPDGTLAAYTAVAAPMVYRGDRLPGRPSRQRLRRRSCGKRRQPDHCQRRRNDVARTEGIVSARGVPGVDRRTFSSRISPRIRQMERSTWSTCIAASFSIATTSPNTFGIRFSDASWRDRLRHGRIYRIVHDTTRRDRKPVLSTESPAALVDRLAHPNGWWRDTAQRLLVERGDRSVVPALEKAAAAANDPRTRLHALWTLEGLDALSVDTTYGALKDPARDVRVSAIRLPNPGCANLTTVRGAVVESSDGPRLGSAETAVRLDRRAAASGERVDGARGARAQRKRPGCGRCGTQRQRRE